MSGELWKYSGRLDDIDILFAQKDFFSYSQGCDYYGLTEKTIVRMARESGAIYKIGKMVRIRRDLFEEYLRSQYKKEDEEDV